jgi:hypothetical protein
MKGTKNEAQFLKVTVSYCPRHPVLPILIARRNEYIESPIEDLIELCASRGADHA